MKQILIALFTLLIVSCNTNPVVQTDDNRSVHATKFEFEGYHYILFYVGSDNGVVLDPNYTTHNDTITLKGKKYVLVK